MLYYLADVSCLYCYKILFLLLLSNGLYNKHVWCKKQFYAKAYGVNPGFLSSVHQNKATRPGQATNTDSCDTVTNVPEELRSSKHMWPKGLSMFYRKYTEAYGIPILGSKNANTQSMKRACYVVKLLFADRYDIRNSYYKLYGRFAVIADTEVLTDIPEYSHMPITWNSRARGLGAQVHKPVSSAGDDNIRCSGMDRYRQEDIMLHELSHGVHLMGASFVIPGFERRLSAAYKKALKKELWKDHYAATNVLEYWAVGATYYYNTEGPYTVTLKGKKITDTGQNILAKYDPDLLDLLKEVFPCNNNVVQRCNYKDCPFDYFTQVKKIKDRQVLDNCKSIFIFKASLDDCVRRTCHWDGNTFMYRDGVCRIHYCESQLKFMKANDGYDIYTMDTQYRNWIPKMTLIGERNQKLKTNCVAASKAMVKVCPNKDRVQCGPDGVNKKLCVKRYACCWTKNMCFYASQSCMDKQIDCREAGHTCESNPYFMLRHCPFTCNVCKYQKDIDISEMKSFCQDHNVACSQWTATGECERNVDFMRNHCPLSCKFCTGQPRCDLVQDRVRCPADSQEHCIMKGCCFSKGYCFYPIDCKDENELCPYAAFVGECERNPLTMLEKCPISCKSCKSFENRMPLFQLHRSRQDGQGCKDEVILHCLAWDKVNECKNNRNWMAKNCALTCKHCHL